MAEVLYRKISYILLVDDVILTVYKVMSFNIRSPLLKTQDRSVETLGSECNLGVEISFIFNETRVALIMSVIYLVAIFSQISIHWMKL